MSGQATVIISGKQWSVNVANTSSEVAAGLSGVTSLAPRTGMLFDLGSPKTSITINMSGMLFPIDIVFMNSNKIVLGVLSYVQPGETGVTFVSDEGARFFLEVNAGEAEGVLPGNVATFSGYTPPAEFNISSIMSLVVTAMIVVMMMQMVAKTMKEAK